MDVSTSILIGAIGVVITLIGVTWKASGWFSALKSTLKGISEDTSFVKDRINYLLGFLAAYPPFRDKIIEEYKKTKLPPNPLDSVSEKEALLGKLQDGTITYEETLRLKQIVEAEEAAARAGKVVGALIAIGGLLLLLKIILDVLGGER